jgi:hypothetical protein
MELRKFTATLAEVILRPRRTVFFTRGRQVAAHRGVLPASNIPALIFVKIMIVREQYGKDPHVNVKKVALISLGRCELAVR